MMMGFSPFLLFLFGAFTFPGGRGQFAEPAADDCEQVLFEVGVAEVDYSVLQKSGSFFWELGNADQYSADTFTRLPNQAFHVVPLPFEFRFYERVYDEVYVSQNGFLSFTPLDENSSLGTPSRVLPSSTAPKAAIFAFWAKMQYAADGFIQHLQVDQDTFLISWHGMLSEEPGTSPADKSFFEIVLRRSGDFSVNLSSMKLDVSNTDEVLVGWQGVKPDDNKLICSRDAIQEGETKGSCINLAAQPFFWGYSFAGDIDVFLPGSARCGHDEPALESEREGILGIIIGTILAAMLLCCCLGCLYRYRSRARKPKEVQVDEEESLQDDESSKEA
ncbi:unnamed protein product [Chrysoparadoxa australica]